MEKGLAPKAPTRKIIEKSTVDLLSPDIVNSAGNTVSVNPDMNPICCAIHCVIINAPTRHGICNFPARHYAVQEGKMRVEICFTVSPL